MVTEGRDSLIKGSFKHTAEQTVGGYSKEKSLLFSDDILSIRAVCKLGIHISVANN